VCAHSKKIAKQGAASRCVKCPHCGNSFCFVDLQRVSAFVDTSAQQYKRRRVGESVTTEAVAVSSATIAQTAETLRAGLARQEALAVEVYPSATRRPATETDIGSLVLVDLL
jgi:hypothetical protein